jgi:hypothetical protein
MLQSDFLLAIGDNIQVGNKVLTVVDIDGEEIIFRVDSLNHPTHRQSVQEKRDDLPRNPR